MRNWTLVALLFSMVACEDGGLATGDRQPNSVEPSPPPKVDEGAPGKRVVQPPVAAEKAPPAAARLSSLPSQEKLQKAAQSYFEGHIGRRIYVQVDKPLYKPGETIWIRTWDLKQRDLSGNPSGRQRYDLVSPRGSVVMS